MSVSTLQGQHHVCQHTTESASCLSAHKSVSNYVCSHTTVAASRLSAHYKVSIMSVSTLHGQHHVSQHTAVIASCLSAQFKVSIMSVNTLQNQHYVCQSFLPQLQEKSSAQCYRWVIVVCCWLQIVRLLHDQTSVQSTSPPRRLLCVAIDKWVQ